MLGYVLLAVFGYKAVLGSVYDLPLNRFGFVRSHDAATGYLKDDGYESALLNKWTRTQSENITTQLNCGVRVFDWRPIMVNGTVFMHHGDVTIPVRQTKLIEELVEWASSSNKLGGDDYEQLVLVNLWDCWNPGCNRQAIKEFVDAGIPTILTPEARNLTVGHAMSLSKLSTSGHVLVLHGVIEVPGRETYSQWLECHGFVDLDEELVWRNDVTTCINRTIDLETPRGIDVHRVLDCILSFQGILMKAEHYNCWKDSKTHDYAYNQLLDYVMNLTSMNPPSGGELWVAQGAWAEDVADIALGFFLDADLLKDEVNSGLNKALAIDIKNRTRILNHPPIVGINNVCDGGEELRQALLGRVRSLAEEIEL